MIRIMSYTNVLDSLDLHLILLEISKSLRKLGAYASITVIFMTGLLLSCVVEASTQLQQFDSVYEPSGVQQLPDGRLLIVEDEKIQSISVVTIQEGGKLAVRPLGRGFVLDWMVGKPVLGKIDDLEGVAVDKQGFVYSITSHSRTVAGRLDKGREKLVRFHVDGNRIVEPQVRDKIKKKILNKHESLKDAIGVLNPQKGEGFNIEGLSFDRNKEKLLIGLRSPLVNKKAVIAVLDNPAAVFENDEKIKISNQLILLDLDKGGIRAIVFDPVLDGYLILSRREDKKAKSFKLWLWNGDAAHAPRRVRFQSPIDIDFAEGISPIRFNDEDRLFFVFDDGNTFKRKGGHYLMLDYGQLIIDESP